jgi:nicotinate-nucleotide adenylyltransferase
VDTLRLLREREPGREFTLLVGADAAAELGAWREAARLPELARIVVFSRPGVPPPPSALVSRVATVPAIEISATEIRRRVARGQSIRYLVPEVVAAHIRQEGLYLKDA